MIGSRLGAYEIVAELGSGGMGKVDRATTTRAVAGLESGCPVALKVIHSHLLETEGFFQRFLREADIGRSVQHDDVVRTYVADALLHDGVQQNYLVMEYVEGQTLRDPVLPPLTVPLSNSWPAPPHGAKEAAEWSPARSRRELRGGTSSGRARNCLTSRHGAGRLSAS